MVDSGIDLGGGGNQIGLTNSSDLSIAMHIPWGNLDWILSRISCPHWSYRGVSVRKEIGDIIYGAVLEIVVGVIRENL